jgi:hypothetical protein
VKDAQPFADIYRHPPTRPEPLYPQPTPDKTAAKCRKDVCLLPDCSCGGKDIPGLKMLLIISFCFCSIVLNSLESSRESEVKKKKDV